MNKQLENPMLNVIKKMKKDLSELGNLYEDGKLSVATDARIKREEIKAISQTLYFLEAVIESMNKEKGE